MTIIKSFDEFISEGLWNKGLNRTKSGEKRIEDITEFDRYLSNDIEWVDINHPYMLFAKFDFDKPLSYNDISKIKLPTGIHIIDEELYEWIKVNCKNIDGKTINDNIFDVYKCKENGNETCFNMNGTSYFLEFVDNYFSNLKSYKEILWNGSVAKNTLKENELDKLQFSIKLAKEK